MIHFNSIILTGGKSSRMQTDKALMEFEGKTLLQTIVNQVQDLSDNVFIISDNASHAVEESLPTPDENKNIGPLGGLQTGLKATKHVWNFVVSCDMPWINIKSLVEQFDAIDKNDCEAIIFKADERLHYLGAFYKKTLLSTIDENILIQDYSLKGLLAKVKHHIVPLVNTQQSFANLNDEMALTQHGLLKLKIESFGQIQEKLIQKSFYMLTKSKNIAELHSEIKRYYPMLKDLTFKIAINHNFVAEDYELKNNDQVVLLPPFAGG